MSARVRGLVALATAVLAFGASAAPVAASTLTFDGGRATFTAAPGIDNVVTLTEGNDNELRLGSANDPVQSVPAGCYDSDGNAAAPHLEVTCNGTTAAEVHTLDGADEVDASAIVSTIGTVMHLGDGPDTAQGSQAVDEIHGGRGDDGIFGNARADRIYGDGGDDALEGDCDWNFNCPSAAPDGADLLDGGTGDDWFQGNGGNDQIVGGSGNDLFEAAEQEFTLPSGATGRDAGDDVFDGGSGFDEVAYRTGGFGPGGQFSVAVDVTLDGVPGDGQAGEADNLIDVEDVRIRGCCADPGSATVTGSAGVNVILTSWGPDTVDALAGNDVIDTRGGDDTVHAVDGFADRIACGEGNDVANVDEFDTTTQCDTVNVTRLGRRATEDAPPTVSWLVPAADGIRLAGQPATLSVDAGDDVGVTQVVFQAGTRVLCTDTRAPYECRFSPLAADVGRTTLLAVAHDALGQTATAARFVEIDRFRPRRLALAMKPWRDRRLPFRFRAAGKLVLPAGMTEAEGCRGRVQVRFKVGKKTISARKAKLRDDCTFRRRVRFTQRYRLRAGRLRVFATFLGNDVLKRKKAKRRAVRIG